MKNIVRSNGNARYRRLLKDFYNEDGTPIGQEDEDLRTLRKPYIRLGQLTSREGEPGKYHDNFTGEDWDSFVAAIFSRNLRLSNFPKEYDGKAKPLCRSENGIVSVDGKSVRIVRIIITYLDQMENVRVAVK